MAKYLGVNAKVYYNSATYGSPTWVDCDFFDEIMEDLKANEAESNSRASMVDLIVATTIALSWTGRMKNTGSATWTIIYEALLERAVLDVMVLTGPNTTNGVTGFRSDVQLFDMSSNQGRTDRIYNTVAIKPTESDNPVKAVLVATGAATFGTITGAALSYS